MPNAEDKIANILTSLCCIQRSLFEIHIIDFFLVKDNS